MQPYARSSRKRKSESTYGRMGLKRIFRSSRLDQIVGITGG
jgi:hypothetical protein